MTTMQDRSWDLAGRLVVAARGMELAQIDAIANLLDPFGASTTAAAADVSLTGIAPVRPEDLAELAGPAKDGRTTARHRDGRLLARFGAHWATVPSLDDAQLDVALEAGLPPSACWADIARPVLHHALHRSDAVAVHAAAVDQAGRATLVTGWSESGKTEVALALVEQGADFLTDKWAVAAADGHISAFPVNVGIRGWVLPALPRLRAALPSSARSQLAAARLADVATRRARRVSGRGRVVAFASHAVTRAVELGDRAGLSPSALQAAYGYRGDPARAVPLGTVVVLVTGSTDAVHVDDVDAAWAASRLARTGAYERRGFFDLQERGAYAGLEGRSGARDASIAREESLLGAVLGKASRVVRITCPFPGDPRRVVDALLRRS
jgi:hypothetical protein